MLLARSLTIAPAAFMTLSTLPLLIIPAPGPAKVLVPISGAARIKFNTQAYTAGSIVTVAVGPAANQNFMNEYPAAIFKHAADWIGAGVGGVNLNQDELANLADQPAYVTVEGADFATGDGNVIIVVFYAIANLP